MMSNSLKSKEGEGKGSQLRIIPFDTNHSRLHQGTVYCECNPEIEI